MKITKLDDSYRFPIIIDGPRDQGMGLTTEEARDLVRQLAPLLFDPASLVANPVQVYDRVPA